MQSGAERVVYANDNFHQKRAFLLRGVFLYFTTFVQTISPKNMSLSTFSEQDLLYQLSQDNVLAFKEIYNRYWHKMYLTALKKTQSNEVAEELVQEIFSKIWERRLTLAIENLETYLFTALKYAVISHIRTLLRARQNENIDTLTDAFILSCS